MKAEAQIGETTVEIDTVGMEKRLTEHLDDKMKKYVEELKTVEKKEAGGKGVVESFSPDAKKTIIEEFQKGDRLDVQKIKEQWTICIPKFAIRELAGHLRDFVFVTDAVKGKPGEVVNIPVVNDIEFAHVTPTTANAFTATTGLINVLTTTLHESGAYYDAFYGDIEKIDSNMLDELNRVFAHAAVRAEDVDLIALINTALTGVFTSEGGGTVTGALAPAFVGTIASALSVKFVADALGQLMKRGKEVHPGDCILYVTPRLWSALIRDVMGSTPMSYSRPDLVKTGVLEDILGVKIVVGAYRSSWHSHQAGASSSAMAYLMRPKRALGLAPKRDILIETDKLIAERQLRITGSHTYGVVAIDMTEVVPIQSLSDLGNNGA
jgi:hypothetical protein